MSTHTLPSSNILQKLIENTSDQAAITRLQWFLRYTECLSITKVCEEFSISRPTFYRWLKRFDGQTVESLQEKKGERTQRTTQHSPIALDAIEEEESLKWFKAFNKNGSVQETCKEFGISRSTFYRALKRMCTEEKIVTSEIQAIEIEEAVKQVAKESGEVELKLQWFNRFNETGSVTLTCSEFGISRSTFYRWLERYDPQALESLRSKRPSEPENEFIEISQFRKILKEITKGTNIFLFLLSFSIGCTTFTTAIPEAEAVAIPHVSTFLETNDTNVGTINVWETVENTAVTHATLNSEGFNDTEQVLLILDVNFEGANASAVVCIRVTDTAGTAVANMDACREVRTADDRNVIYRLMTRTTKTSGEGFQVQKQFTAGSSAHVFKSTLTVIGLDDLTENDDYVYGESTSSADIPASGSPATFATISTPSGDSNWQGDVLVMDSFVVDVTGCCTDAIVHGLRRDSDSTINVTQTESEDNNDFQANGSIYVYNNADTNAHTYDVRLENQDSSTTSYDHEYSSIIAFRASLFEDFYSANTDGASTPSSSFTELAGITPFTPQTAGDFMIMGHAVVDHDTSNADDCRLRLQVGGTTVPSGYNESTEGTSNEDANDRTSVNWHSIENLAASSQDIDLDGACDNGTTPHWEYRTLVAFSFEKAAAPPATPANHWGRMLFPLFGF